MASLSDNDLCVQVMSGRDGGSDIDAITTRHRHMKQLGFGAGWTGPTRATLCPRIGEEQMNTHNQSDRP